MKKFIIFCNIFLLFFQLHSQNLSEKQKSIVYSQAVKILNQYQDLLNQIADEAIDISKVTKTSEKLIDLFITRKVLVYNDLDPLHQLSEYYELDSYFSNLLLWYPDGMRAKLDIDNINAGTIQVHTKDIFTLDVLINKKIDGNYLNKLKNNNSEDLLFRLAFYKDGGNIKNLRIAGIRSTKNKQQNDSLILNEVKGMHLSLEEMQKIKNQVKSMLSNYTSYLNLLVDPKEKNEDKEFYKTSFLSLFKDYNVKLVNDIGPSPQKRWLDAQEYTKEFIRSYPSGIHNLSLNIDSAEFGNVIPDTKEKSTIKVSIDKFFSGKYEEKTIYRDNSKLDIKICFERDENTYKNFKIEGIDKGEMNNLFEQTVIANQSETPKLKITSLKYWGFYFGLSFSYDLSTYNNPNLTSDNILGWSTTGKSGIKIGINAKYYLGNQLAIESGVMFNRYSSNANLTGEFHNDLYQTDPNNKQFLKTVYASYDSLISLNYLSIPISLVFNTSKTAEKISLFIKAGVVGSFLMSAKYRATGNFKTSGYYENGYFKDSTGFFKNIDSLKLGFVNFTNLDASGKTRVKTFNLSLIISIGVTIPLNYFTSIELGPEIIWGVTNISNQNEFIDAFGNTKTAKAVNIAKYGFRAGLYYKF
jgi:Outer membrane protein beta-barrel domain